MRNRFVTPTLSESTLSEPWSDLRREIDRVFDSVLSGVRPATFDHDMRWMPPMDVEERDDRIRLSFEIPGVDRDDVSVTVENGVLTVSGEKKSERETSEGVDGSRVVERRYGRFERSLALPQSVDPDRVSARYANGVLVLDLPKSAESRRRTIEIGAGKEQQSLESGDRGSRKVA